MHHSFSPIFIILVFAVVIIGAVVSWLQAKKRRDALLALAEKLGLLYSAGSDDQLPENYGGSHLCSRGHSKRASNVIWGKLGDGDVVYFDYRFVEGSGKNQTTYTYGACAFESPYFWRTLIVRPESFLDKAAAFFGFEDIKLDNAEFNKKFCVKSEDKKFAYDVLSQRAEEFFLARPGITMEMLGGFFLFYRTGTVPPAEVENLIVSSAEFFKLIPHFLKEDRGLKLPDAAAARYAGGAGASTTAHQGDAGASVPGFVPSKQAEHKRPEPLE